MTKMMTKTSHFYICPWVRKALKSKKRHVVIHGGRGSGKSDGLAQLLIIKAVREDNVRIICSRHIQRSIKESSLARLEHWIQKMGLSNEFVITRDEIYHLKRDKKTGIRKKNSKFMFFGLSDVTKNNVTSVSDVKYLWVDEAHGITHETWKRVYPSIRSDESQIYITFNPHKKTDTMYKEFVSMKREDTLAMQVNYTQNPFFKKTPLEEIRRVDEVIRPRWEYLHIWEGACIERDDSCVILTDRFGRYSIETEHNYELIAIAVDTAHTVKTYGDYSVIGAFGKIQGRYHVLHILKGRWIFNELKQRLCSFHQYIIDKYKQCNVILIENKTAGTPLIQDLQSLTTLGNLISPVNPTKDKYTRVSEVHEILHGGVFLTPMQQTQDTQWVEDYLDELSKFTANDTHDHDDQVDVTAMALSWLKNNSPGWDWSQL